VDSVDAALEWWGQFLAFELREQVTGLYGVAPEIRFVEVAALVENRVAVAA